MKKIFDNKKFEKKRIFGQAQNYRSFDFTVTYVSLSMRYEKFDLVDSIHWEIAIFL